jgi:PTS system nitrogen regulatory IIA component
MFLNLIQIAESFGVSEKTVEGWIRFDGLPHTEDRGRVIFDRAQVAQWAATRGLATRAGFLAPVASLLEGGSYLEPLLRGGGIWRNVTFADLSGVFEKVVAALPGVTPAVMQMVAKRLAAKGGVTFAPVGDGFALPHPSARIALGRGAGTIALILLKDPLIHSEPQLDEVPVTRLFFFVAPSPRAHLDILGRLSRILARGPLRELVTREAPDQEIFRTFAEFDAASANGGKA